MNLEFLKIRKELLPKLMRGVLAVCAVLVLGKFIFFVVFCVHTNGIISKADAAVASQQKDIEKLLAGSKAIADELKKKNLLSPPVQNECPVKEISGIIGNETLINGKWYKVGDKIGEAKIVAIGNTEVKIEYEGKEKTFAPINSIANFTPEPPKVEKKEEGKAVKADPNKEAKPAEAPKDDDPLAWMGVKLSDKARARLLEMWNKMTDEQKAQFKEQWNKMSDEQKQSAAASMDSDGGEHRSGNRGGHGRR
jgi:hypothetical protein